MIGKKMDMNKELEQKLSKISVEKDLANKERELAETEYNIKNNDAEITNLKEEIKVFGVMSKAMLDNYFYINPTRTYEEDPTFLASLKQKQVIDNRRQLMRFNLQIRALEKEKRQQKEHAEGLITSIKIVREELEEQE